MIVLHSIHSMKYSIQRGLAQVVCSLSLGMRRQLQKCILKNKKVKELLST